MYSNESSDTRLNTLVEKLKIQLNNFAVLDRQGEIVGQVKDVVVDAKRQLNLVVFCPTANRPSPFFLLASKLIQKIDPPNKSVSAEINRSQIEQLPEYLSSEVAGIVNDKTVNNQTSDKRVQSTDMAAEYSDNLEVREEKIVQLLEEKLVVNLNKRKIGEVIVRKEVETRMLQIPVRYEKLIVEQVSPEPKQIAEIDLSSQEISRTELAQLAITKSEFTDLNGQHRVSGEFKSPEIANLVLSAIARERNHGCKKVRLEIVVEDEERQKTYQEWFNDYKDTQQL